jgi:hypothetical protein
MSNSVDRLYEEALAIIEKLDTEISLKVSAGDYFRKSLLLAAVSYFEHAVTNGVMLYLQECAPDASYIHKFVESKAVKRQYHTWFSWKDNNANAFFALFGDEFKAYMGKEIAASQELRDAIKAFIELGRERNELVHQDYASFPMEKSLDEVYETYKKALVFVEKIPISLRHKITA